MGLRIFEAPEGLPGTTVFDKEEIDDLKKKSVQGGAITVIAQGAKFILQTVSAVVLARLLSPADFGLQSMVVAMIGFLGLFRDAGLSVATVQREIITHEQTSTLFWINTGIGVLLAVLSSLLAPLLVHFFREPKLYMVTIVSGSAFIFNGIAAQHQALLIRKLRFSAMALIDMLSLAAGVLVAIVMAFLDFGYWALIGMAVAGPLVAAICLWVAVPWTPGLPRRKCGIRSMLHLGGTTTANMVVIYAGYNTEKFLLGRFWGASPLGLYSKAYQLVNMPLQQMSNSIFNVIFPALSRIQDDTDRLCRFFLKSYSLVVSICMPITICCALFAQDIIPIVLGPKWVASIPILRLLSPTIMAFALMNPFGWLLLSTGRAWRSLQISFLVTPLVILGVVSGLAWGPRGVATGYSIATGMLVIPVISWAIHKTGMSGKDVWNSIKAPACSGTMAALVGILFLFVYGDTFHPMLRLAGGLFVTMGTYLLVLLFLMHQRDFYLDLLKQIFHRA